MPQLRRLKAPRAYQQGRVVACPALGARDRDASMAGERNYNGAPTGCQTMAGAPGRW